MDSSFAMCQYARGSQTPPPVPFPHVLRALPVHRTPVESAPRLLALSSPRPSHHVPLVTTVSGLPGAVPRLLPFVVSRGG
ncbi:unnamed protein product, partial [Closterium sp. NIES-64]